METLRRPAPGVPRFSRFQVVVVVKNMYCTHFLFYFWNPGKWNGPKPVPWFNFDGQASAFEALERDFQANGGGGMGFCALGIALGWWYHTDLKNEKRFEELAILRPVVQSKCHSCASNLAFYGFVATGDSAGAGRRQISRALPERVTRFKPQSRESGRVLADWQGMRSYTELSRSLMRASWMLRPVLQCFNTFVLQCACPGSISSRSAENSTLK